MKNTAAEQFARFVIEIEPYANEVVFVGGWVHSLYLAEANEIGGVRTDDVDVTIPHVLLTANRPTLLQIAENAGFARDPISDLDGAGSMMVYTNENGDTIPVDFLTEGEPRKPVEIEGQPGLLAQGYPGQQMLMDNARDMMVGSEIHELLTPSRKIRVPQIGAYSLQKGISSRTRKNPLKAAKDLVYLFEIARHPILGVRLFEELPSLCERYPSLRDDFRLALEDALLRESLMMEIVEQLMHSGRAVGDASSITSRVAAYFNRLHAV